MFFRGSIAPRAPEFAHLESAGIKIRVDTPDDPEAWAVRLSHRQWGEARMAALNHTVPVPRAIVKHDNRMDESEKGCALLGQSSVHLRLEGEKTDVLCDRKRLLRFVNAVMGDDGLIALDVTATRFTASSYCPFASR